jgi:hypothetical protein
MEKSNICIILLLLQITLNSTCFSGTIRQSFWQKVSYACRSLGNVAKTTFISGVSKLKNVLLTTRNISKVALLTTATAAALYGLSCIKKYFFGSKKTRQANVPPITTIPTQPAIPVEPQNPVPGAEQARTQIPISVQPQELQAPSAQEHEPIAAAAQAPAPVPQVQIAAAAAAVPVGESLADVPYFAERTYHVIDPIQVTRPDGTEITVQQLCVLNQFEVDPQTRFPLGGGETSCGYHAGPKNITAIAGLIQGLDTSRLLTDSQPALDLFNPRGGETGRLRTIVNNQRIKTALREYYKERLTDSLPNEYPITEGITENPFSIQSFYRQLIRDYLDQIISQAVDQRQAHEITMDGVIAAFQHMPLVNIAPETLNDLNCTEQKLVEFIRDPSNIRRYVSLPETPLRISQEDIGPALARYNQLHNPRLEENGDLLNSYEIQYLLDLQQREQERILNPRYVSSTVLEDTSPLLLQTITRLRDQLQARQLPEQRIHAFVLGNTDQGRRSQGHWITLVLEVARNRRRYSIANSAHNHIKMFRGAIRDIISFLEGEDIAQLIRPSDGLKKRLTDQLREAIAICKQHHDDRSRERLQTSLENFQEIVNDYSSFGGAGEFERIVTPLLAPGGN